jgi:hypothetical protein
MVVPVAMLLIVAVHGSEPDGVALCLA